MPPLSPQHNKTNLSHASAHQIPQTQPALVPFVVIREKLLKRQRPEAALVIVSQTIRAVLGAVDARDINAEQRVGQQPGALRRVRKPRVDDERRQQRQHD